MLAVGETKGEGGEAAREATSHRHMRQRLSFLVGTRSEQRSCVSSQHMDNNNSLPHCLKAHAAIHWSHPSLGSSAGASVHGEVDPVDQPPPSSILISSATLLPIPSPPPAHIPSHLSTLGFLRMEKIPIPAPWKKNSWAWPAIV